MKRTILIAAFIAAFAYCGYAEVDDFSRTWSLITTNSDTATQICRGLLEGVEVDGAATKTNVILVTYAGQTLYSQTVTGDTNVSIRVPVVGATAAALANTYSVWNGVTNSTGTNPLYDKFPLAGAVTIRAAGAADTTGTNSVTVKVKFSK